MASDIIIPLQVSPAHPNGLYSFKVPIKEPSDEKQILNYNVKKKDDQIWITPPILDVKRMSVRDRIAYIERERQRWDEGVFVLINGELKYLTGLMYDHLTYCTYNSQKLMYFDDERFIFYFIKLTEDTPECEGRCWVKPRRAKMTTIMCSLAQYKLLSDFSNFVTIQSDTLDKAQKSYMTPIIDSYVRRPLWIREQYYAPNGKKPRKALELSSNIIEETGQEWMGGKINIFPTVAKATDGLEAIEGILDEFSKIEDVLPYEMFEVLRKVVQNFRKQGRIDCLSSSGDTKDAVKATMDWHKLIANSNPLRKDQYGKTVSGLWEYFISAIHSQYVPKEFTDKFGIVDKGRAEEWITNEHNKHIKGSKEQIFSMYRLPLKKEHALLSSAATKIFPEIRMNARIADIEGMGRVRPYVRCSLIEKEGKIYKEPDDAGIWMWALDMHVDITKGINMTNRFKMRDGVFYPYHQVEGCVGYDPINYPKGQTSSNHLSQACAMGHKKFDYSGSGFIDMKVAFLLIRPDDPRTINKELIKFCKFTGYLCIHERSIPHVFEDFRDAGMLNFLMKGEDGIYGISQSNIRARQDGISMMQSRYASPKEEGQRDQVMEHPFEDALRSHVNFDNTNTTAFDPTMTEIYLECGLKQLKETNQTEERDKTVSELINEIIVSRTHQKIL